MHACTATMTPITVAVHASEGAVKQCALSWGSCSTASALLFLAADVRAHELSQRSGRNVTLAACMAGG